MATNNFSPSLEIFAAPPRGFVCSQNIAPAVTKLKKSQAVGIFLIW